MKHFLYLILASTTLGSPALATNIGRSAMDTIKHLGGATADFGRSIGDSINDGFLTSSIKTAYIEDKGIDASRIDIDTRDRVVYLNGEVSSSTNFKRAEEIAKNTKGVRSVVNNLVVIPR